MLCDGGVKVRPFCHIRLDFKVDHLVDDRLLTAFHIASSLSFGHTGCLASSDFALL